MSKAEKFIQLNTKKYSNETTRIGSYDHTYHEWLTPEQALAAVKLAREELIDKACEYMRNHIDPQLTIYHDNTWEKRDEFIEDFKNYIEVCK